MWRLLRDVYKGKPWALGPAYESDEKNSLFLLLGLICMCVGDCVHAFMSVCIWVPFLTSVLGVLREWHNLRISVRGCEFAQGFWGPQVGKAVGEWALVCTDEWGSGWGWYSLAGCYDSPLPPQASPLFTRIESPCTHPLPLARAHTDTHMLCSTCLTRRRGVGRWGETPN